VCRLYGFRSALTSTVHSSLVAAENALARQSERHRDGWGIAFYVDRYPHLLRSDKPALEDRLFSEVSTIVQTQCMLAHIRKATVGSIGVLNCHPFQHGAWTFAHNGEIRDFVDDEGIRDRIQGAVDDRFRSSILGSTDSETIFYLLLSKLQRQVENLQAAEIGVDQVVPALEETVAFVREVADRPGRKPSLLNFLLTNGRLLIGFRHGFDLYFSTHKSRCPERSSCSAFEACRCEQTPPDGMVKHLIVASEPISEDANVWEQLAEDELIAVEPNMRVVRRSLTV